MAQKKPIDLLVVQSNVLDHRQELGNRSQHQARVRVTLAAAESDRHRRHLAWVPAQRKNASGPPVPLDCIAGNIDSLLLLY